jgi:hypothetical protein
MRCPAGQARRLKAFPPCACCQTPILVLPDDVPAHPYVVAMETVHLAPNAQVSLYPWKDTPDKIPLAVRHIRTFLRAHRPVAAAQSMAAAAH